MSDSDSRPLSIGDQRFIFKMTGILDPQGQRKIHDRIQRGFSGLHAMIDNEAGWEKEAAYFFRELTGCTDAYPWGENWHRLYEYLAAHHGLTPKHIGRLTFGDIAQMLRADYEARERQAAGAATEAPAAIPRATKGSDSASLEPNGWYGARDLARRLNLPGDTVAKRLERWRNQHPEQSGKGWMEAQDPGPKDPKYLFRYGAVKEELSLAHVRH